MLILLIHAYLPERKCNHDFQVNFMCMHPANSETEFKEFERRFKFKPRFKYGWFHLKLYQMFKDLNRHLI